jgi:glutamine synthetase
MQLSRFLLHRVAEQFGIGVTFEPKPVPGDWSGSGNHCNYSTKASRSDGGLAVIQTMIERLE